MAKTSDRLKALQERATALAAPTPAPPSEPTSTDAPSPDETTAAMVAAEAHFGVPPGLNARSVQRITVGQIAPDVRPEHRQARLLPLPDELLLNGDPVPIYYDLVNELRELSLSLQERQIQPIIVYPGTSEIYPAARYLILVGHRRWTAASLYGPESLDVIVIDEPVPADRVLLQYAENEAREEFSDMERAWAILQLKQAMGDVPWETVEDRMKLSRARRQQLLRLAAFSPDQQQELARLRLQETQLRSLHSALRAGELDSAKVDALLRRLALIAAERSADYREGYSAEDGPGGQPPRRAGIDGPTVARLVAKAKRAEASPTPAPRWATTLREQAGALRRGLSRAHARMEDLEADEVETLRADLETLRAEVDRLVEILAQE